MNWLKTLGLSVLAVFAPIKMVIISVGVVIFADMFFGIWAAHKRGEKITSAAMRRTITKMFTYQGAILTGYLGETYLLSEIIPVVKLISGIIGLVEIKSLLENISEISGLNFKSVIKMLGSDNDKDSNPNPPQNQGNQSGPQ